MMIRRCWVRIIPVLWLNVAIAAQPAQSSAGGLRQLAEGVESLEAQRLPQAVYALTSARTAVPSLRDYASFFLAQAQYRSRRFAESAAAAEEVTSFQPLSPLAGRAAVLGARAWLELKQPRKSLSLLARVAQETLSSAEAQMVRARALEDAGSSLDAVAGFQTVYYLYPLSPDSKEAGDGLQRMRSVLGAKFPEASMELRFDRAGKLREAGELASARREYEALADLGGAAGDLARLRIAALPYYDGEATTALSRLEALGRQSGEIEAERLYLLVQCNRRLERDDEMAAALDALVAAAPRSPWRLKALSAGSSRFLVKDDPRQQQVFEACAEAFPDAPEAVMCNWHAAWWAYRHRQAGADQLLRRHLQLYPASDKAGAALFYLGRSAAKANDAPAALAWFRYLARRFPNYYYSFEARAELQSLESRRTLPSRQVEDFLAGVHFPDRPQQADLTPDAATSKRIERARLLSRVNLDTWAEGELRFAARNGAQPWPLAIELAEAASRSGAPDRALRQIKNVLPAYLFMPRTGAPQRFWRLAFPLPYQTLVVKYSMEAGLDPFLVAALIRQESEFNPRALSVSKAVGLMQIMPAVGSELARKLPLRGFRTSLLTTPEINIRLGTYYLRRLLDSCNGKIEDALAAYNAGRSRVTLWRGWGPFEDINEFAESIPFAQTRDYVQIILRNAELYRWLYASEQVVGDATIAVAPVPESGTTSPSRESAAAVKTGALPNKPSKRAASATKTRTTAASGAARNSAKKALPKAPATKRSRSKHRRPPSL